MTREQMKTELLWLKGSFFGAPAGLDADEIAARIYQLQMALQATESKTDYQKRLRGYREKFLDIIKPGGPSNEPKIWDEAKEEN